MSPFPSHWLFRPGEGQGRRGQGPEARASGAREKAGVPAPMGFFSTSLGGQDSWKCRHSPIRALPGGLTEGMFSCKGVAGMEVPGLETEGPLPPQGWKGGYSNHHLERRDMPLGGGDQPALGSDLSVLQGLPRGQAHPGGRKEKVLARRPCLVPWCGEPVSVSTAPLLLLLLPLLTGSSPALQQGLQAPLSVSRCPQLQGC